MPPVRVPELLAIRLLAICRLCPQACTLMPPPPWELLVIPRPSMLEGLHQKLLGNGLWAPELFGPQPLVASVVLFSSVVPTGKVSAANGFVGKLTPFDNTVMAAPSSAPIRVGSCNNSARLPLSVASQPTVASSGSRSTCGLREVGVQAVQPAPQEEFQVVGEPLGPSPNRQVTRVRQSFILPAGWGLALIILEEAPTPCSRTGFHIKIISW